MVLFGVLFISGNKMKKIFLLCLILVSCTAFSKMAPYQPLLYEYKNEVNCLAKNVYFEARDQPTKGQIAVALVTINRAKSKRFPNTICRVVEQASRYKSGKLKRNMCQFSWYCDGVSDIPREKIAWGISLLIARAMLKQPGGYITHFGEPWVIDDFLNGATHYHNLDVNPYWNRKMLKVITIGDHIFWKDYLNN